MSSLNKFSFYNRLLFTLSLISIGGLIILGITIYLSQKSRLEQQAQKQMNNHLQDMVAMLDLQIKEK
jgi:hypothetical protein